MLDAEQTRRDRDSPVPSRAQPWFQFERGEADAQPSSEIRPKAPRVG